MWTIWGEIERCTGRGEKSQPDDRAGGKGRPTDISHYRGDSVDERHFGTNLVEQFPGAVPVGPGIDIRPVQGIVLDRKHVDEIGGIFHAIALIGPAQFLNYDIFGTRQDSLPTMKGHFAPTFEANSIERVVTE